jgi:hypothetical protein
VECAERGGRAQQADVTLRPVGKETDEKVKDYAICAKTTC